jgi:hypothetical protein
LIDWSAGTAPMPLTVSAVAARTSNWQDEFVNHLAKTEAQRNPNAGLRIQVDLSPKLGATSQGVQAAL